MKIHNAPAETLERHLNGWLDAMMEVYGDILAEWNENDIVQPWDEAKTDFSLIFSRKSAYITGHTGRNLQYEVPCWNSK